MTDNLKAFVAANRASPVVEGEAIGMGGEGARYWLQDGKRFTLTVEECRAIPDGPRWAIA